MSNNRIEQSCAYCASGLEDCTCHRPQHRAVLMLNLGTPESPEVADVRRYLREFLSDPFVIKLPRRLKALTPALASIIAQFRGPKSAEAYRSIWWDEGSPLKVITERQRDALRQKLGKGWSVYYAMRYASPGISEVLDQMTADGVTDMVVLPMYPQWAGPTTGTALEVLYRELHRKGLRFNLSVRAEWYDDRGYIESQAHLIRRFLAEKDLSPRSAFLLFSTHSMPVSYIKDGDPYEGQVRRSVELVRQRLGWPEERAGLSFQSKLGPVEWLTPSTEESLCELAAKGEKDVAVCPISFTADCLETLEEIGIRYAGMFAEESRGGRLHLMPALNEDPAFIDTMASLTRKGPRPLRLDQAAPLQTSAMEEPITRLISRLVMVGVATAGRLEDANSLPFVDEGVLRSLRQECIDVRETLELCTESDAVDGCFALNTCQRCEVYALTNRGASLEEAAAHIHESFFEHLDAAVAPVVLQGANAYRRLLRTALGLNSMLPGDGDVMAQLRSAGRMAQHAGTRSPGLNRLLHETDALETALRSDTAWGQLMTPFAAAAMCQLGVGFDPTAADGLLIGGSTTCRQLLRLLTKDGQLHGDRLTFAYRGAGRKELVKYIRRVAPHVQRLRVDRYDDPRVLEGIAHADVVFFGIDHREPVLQQTHIEGLRDFTKRPLTVIDFNGFGSTEGLEDLEGVRLISAGELNRAAAAFGEHLMSKPGFGEAYDEAVRFVESATCAAAWDTESRDCENGPCETCEGESHSADSESAHGGVTRCAM